MFTLKMSNKTLKFWKDNIIISPNEQTWCNFIFQNAEIWSQTFQHVSESSEITILLQKIYIYKHFIYNLEE